MISHLGQRPPARSSDHPPPPKDQHEALGLVFNRKKFNLANKFCVCVWLFVAGPLWAINKIYKYLTEAAMVESELINL